MYKSGHSCVLDHFFLLESVSRLHHSIRGGVGVDLWQFGTGPPGGNGGWGVYSVSATPPFTSQDCLAFVESDACLMQGEKMGGREARGIKERGIGENREREKRKKGR